MKAFSVALLFLVFAVAARADILVNSTFADGSAHWKGDGKEIDTDDISAGNQPGMTVTLQKEKWTKIYQTFSTHERKVSYKITFTLSPDYLTDKGAGGSGDVSGLSPVLDDIEGMYPLELPANGGCWTLIVEDFGIGSSAYLYPRPDTSKTVSQTLTGHLQGLNSDNEKIIILAFPPGEGTITFTNVSLTPDKN